MIKRHRRSPFLTALRGLLLCMLFVSTTVVAQEDPALVGPSSSSNVNYSTPEATVIAPTVEATVPAAVENTPTPEIPTETPMAEMTADATPEPTPAAETTETPVVVPETTDAPVDITEEPTPQPTAYETLIVTPEITPEPTPAGDAEPLYTQTSCRLEITDLGDNNPFTYRFSAAQTNNIASYAWDVDVNVNPGVDSSAQIYDHTYPAPGTYNITLVCTPQPGFGGTITLNASITINPIVIASFDFVQPQNSIGTLPFTVDTVNTSVGTNVNYVWRVSSSSVATDPGLFPDSTNTNLSVTLTSAEITLPGLVWFHLTVTDPTTSITSVASKSFSIEAPPPSADFTIDPASGPAPLTVTIQGIDLGEGPITSWEWDFDEDGIFDDATGIGPHTLTNLPIGLYEVSFQYSGPGGFGSGTKQINVYPDGEPVFAQFSFELRGAVPGGYEVCFTNTSTGPYVTSQWDFDAPPAGEGTYDLTDNASVVCHVYPTTGPRTVRLRVSASDPLIFSTTSAFVDVAEPPVADFNISPGANIVWGTMVTFTDASFGGTRTEWEWDFNGDGVIDSTLRNPPAQSLLTLGANPIRLTVRGPGGESFVEKIVTVARLELVCDFTGSLDVLPNSAAQTYTQNLLPSSIGGRPVTYNWSVTGSGVGLPLTFSNTPNFSIDWDNVGFGSFQVTLEASTTDGSFCTTTKTVDHDWLPIGCTMSSTLPGTLYAAGGTFDFTANVSNLNGRAVIGYDWYLNGGLVQSGPNATYTWTNTTDTSVLPLNVDISYQVTVDNGPGYSPTTSSCGETRLFTVQPWPDLTCPSLGGTFNPVPVNNNTGAIRDYTYTISPGGIQGRTISYVWTVDGGTITTANPSTTGSVTVQWDPARGSLPPAPTNENISVLVTVTNPDGTTDTCTSANGVQVRYQNLGCAAPSGDQFVVVGETETYTRNVSITYGRTLTNMLWTLEQLTPVAQTTTYTNIPVDLTFLEPGATYRLRYSLDALANGGIPADSCTSPWLNITAYDDGVNWQCESTAISGDNTPDGNETYTVVIDNGNVPPIELRYRWILTDYLGADYTLATVTSTAQGTITSPSFTLNQLAPLGPDNYTLRVEIEAVDTDLSTNTCIQTIALVSGSFNVQYDYTTPGWGLTNIPIDQDICLTNTTTVQPGSLSTLNYTWTVSGDPANNSWGTLTDTGDNPATPCISFSVPGSYTIRLDGVTDSTLRSGTFSRTFNVYGLQSIVVNRIGTDFSLSQNFTANGTNITGAYNWVFTRISDGNVIATRNNQQNPTNVTFPSAGFYRATVTGSGPLGNTSASLDFEIKPPGSLAARFRASQYGGVAPMNVCFTDLSVTAPGSNITLWEWDLNGNGSYGDAGIDVSYTPAGIPGSICYNFTTPGTVNVVRLRVTNNTGFVDVAQNVIRTYNPLEANSTFSITPQGGGRYCYTAIISANVTVISWDFGDGTTAPGSDTACHTYASSGAYLVSMCIEDPTGSGCVVREVVVTINGGAPSLTASADCSPQRTATFRITNNGANMQFPDQATFRDLNGTVISIVPFQLTGGGTWIEFTFPDTSGQISMTTTDSALSVSTVCNYPPSLSVAAVCTSNLPVFTVTNNAAAGDNPMLTSQNWEIRNSLNAIVASGTFQLSDGPSTQDFSVPVGSNPYETYTFSSTGTSGDVSNTTNCATQPTLGASSTCAYPLVFTITNTGSPMVVTQTYEIRDSSNTVVASDTYMLGTGQSLNIPLTGLDPYAEYTLTSTGFAGSITETSDCADPVLTISSVCQYPLVFTVTNDGADMLTPQAYEITDGNSVVVSSGSLDLNANESVNITLTGLNPYVAYTFSSDGFAGDYTYAPTPCAQPQLTVTRTCAYPVTFEVTNNGGPMLTPQAYAITDSGSATVDSGSLNLADGASTTLTLTGLNPYEAYTFSSTGFAGDYTFAPAPCAQPQLNVSSDCAYPIVFTVVNNGGDMLTPQAYTVSNTGGDVVASGDFSLASGANFVVTLTGLDPYAGYTFETSGFAGDTSLTQNCLRPLFAVTYSCEAEMRFTIVNNGGDMLLPQVFEIHDASGSMVSDSSVQLAALETIIMTVPDANPYLAFRILTDGFAGDGDLTRNCEDPVLTITSYCDAPPRFIVSNIGGDMLVPHTFTLTTYAGVDVTPADNTFQLASGLYRIFDVTGYDLEAGLNFITDFMEVAFNGAVQCFPPPQASATDEPEPTPTPVRVASGSFQGLNEVPVSLPNWNNVSICGGNCPTIRLYHTDETGDWEIFRLDGANEETRETFRQNLSYGEGRGIDDMAPSISPNSEWIVFTSNRDGNWEIYVASTSGDPNSVQRVTYNTIANDTDPVWGPTNFVVFETTRHGSWDLYMIDMTTGQEFRLTDSEGDDINAFWSPDGSRIVFQSNRPDENGVRQWQLYEMNLRTGTVSKLSDGTSVDVDPQYSNDGTQIVYRTYSSGSDNSVLMLMNANGTNKRAITTPDADATNAAWSPFDRYIAYQSDADGDLDIYVYELATGDTRHLTDNAVPDYAPTWRCSEEEVVFTSDVEGDPNIYEALVQPIPDGPILVEEDAAQFTFEAFNDIYPQSFPPEENASREGQTVVGTYGEQTSFLLPNMSLTPIDFTLDTIQREDWNSINSCPPAA